MIEYILQVLVPATAPHPWSQIKISRTTTKKRVQKKVQRSGTPTLHAEALDSILCIIWFPEHYWTHSKALAGMAPNKQKQQVQPNSNPKKGALGGKKRV